ncbi:FecR family protein [Massilibacteroides sp.]|uniref:FecR family protein n=1 Tax=Massilibacteroides sp. TaxID=2034766 RepID=UPI00262645D9|nr:FecR family protein [Massilibacteroides sp.]MDD4514467.1 FecR family protein [Massilibacteroides sp.]
MEKLNEKYHQLALAYFNGTISLQEEGMLFDFISSDDAHLTLFRQWEKEWIASSDKNLSVQKDWKQLQQRMVIRDSFLADKKKSVFTLRKIIAAVAAVLLIAVSSIGSFLLYQSNQKQPYYTLMTAPGEKSRIVLTDGSTVWLNAGSTLRYSAGFGNNNREVELEGEAYFEVNKLQDQSPFLVKTSHYDVLVKGTKFNINSYEEDPTSSVTLIEGSIDVIAQNKTVNLRPGELLSLNKASGQFLRHAVQAYQYKSWIDGRIEYDEITLSELAIRLSRKYDVNIYLDEALEKDEKFKVSLRNEETIGQFLQALSQVIEIRFERNDRDIYIMKQ